VITKAVAARAHTRTFAVGVDYIAQHTHQRAMAAAGVTFEGGVAYASAPEKAAWVHLRGVTSVETAAIEMEAVAVLSARCRDPVYHLIIAYAKHERPTREQVVSDAERLLKAIGMDDRQYVLAAHKDTDDFHAHVIANRIGPDGRANDQWHERIIRERTCAEIAAERGWNIVVGHHNRDIIQRIERLHDLPPDPQWRPSDGAYRRLHKDGQLPWQDAARPYVLDAVDGARNWSELHERLRVHGVIVKLVRRGERAQGLAFAEGFDRTAPGCAASRVDTRCALSALERRFGPFMPAHDPPPTVAHGVPWSDAVRPTILEALDTAGSWDELRQRLNQHGIVIKLVERGGRAQGFAFAQGHHPDAPGCAASRVHPRCKKAALEQRFGPFRDAEQKRQERASEDFHKGARSRNRGMVRNRAEAEASSDPRWALHEASRIANHARMRTAYEAYRDRFFADKNRVFDDRRKAAWEREQAQRRAEARHRRETRLLLRAVARLGARGRVARQIAFWSIDAVIARRRAREYDAARVRWESTKIVLAAERGLVRKEKPMDYRLFVAEKARAGDAAAQRVLDTLLAPAGRTRQTVVIEHKLSLGEARARLNVIRAEQEARYERARVERGSLPPVEKPPAIKDVVAAERARTERDVAERMKLTDAELARLTQLGREKRSWNPFIRAAAVKAETEIRREHRSRYETALAKAMLEFERRDVPQVSGRAAADDRRYHEWVSASLGLEAQMREARTELRDRIPQIEHQVNVLQRCGASEIAAYGINDGLNSLASAVRSRFQALPEAMRRDAEHAIRRERRHRDRARDSISM
jgi:hypothetical protein